MGWLATYFANPLAIVEYISYAKLPDARRVKVKEKNVLIGMPRSSSMSKFSFHVGYNGNY